MPYAPACGSQGFASLEKVLFVSPNMMYPLVHRPVKDRFRPGGGSVDSLVGGLGGTKGSLITWVFIPAALIPKVTCFMWCG